MAPPIRATTATTTTTSSSSSSSSSFTIHYFAAASSYTSLSSEVLPAPMQLSELFPSLESRYPGITAVVLRSCAVTVNLEYVDIEEQDGTEYEEAVGAQAPAQAQHSLPWGKQQIVVIQPGDEVGIIPPVSSG